MQTEIYNLNLKVGDAVQHEDGTTGKIESFYIAADGTLQAEIIIDGGGYKADEIKTFTKRGTL